jgi:hypothetical protein
MTPPPDHAGLARLARILQANRANTDWDTDSLAVAGIGRITLIDTGAARAIDSVGREITTVDGPDPDTALRGLIDLLARLADADADQSKDRAIAPCTPRAPTDRLCARIAEASAALAESLSSWLATPANARCDHSVPDVGLHRMRIWAGINFALLARYSGIEFEATAHLPSGMTFAAAVGTSPEEALTRLRDTLAQEATR